MKKPISLIAVLAICAAAHAAASKPHMVVDGKARDEAKGIIADAGIQGGLIVHLGCGDGTLTAALRINDRYVVHGLDRDPRAFRRCSCKGRERWWNAQGTLCHSG